MALEPDRRVLLVEDSPVYQRLISGHLREWGFETVSAIDGMQAWALLQRPDSPALAILDWVMPKMDGIEVCRKLRERSASSTYVYTILLTGKDGPSDLVKAMEAGADDYLTKPFNQFELKARLSAGSRILNLQRELVASRDAMRYSASHDSLTGLLNRKEILDAFRRELSRSKRDKKPVSIMLIDLDHFKLVNDELGHLNGDEVLKEVAYRLRWSLRDYDSVGRYGGEEFLIVLPGCDLTGALVRAEQVRMRVGSCPVRMPQVDRLITISIGVAVSDSGEEEASQLLHLADVGLYRAKKTGRNRVEQLDADAAEPRLSGSLVKQ